MSQKQYAVAKSLIHKYRQSLKCKNATDSLQNGTINYLYTYKFHYTG